MNVLRNISITGSEGKTILYDLYVQLNGSKKPVVIFAHGFKGFKDWGCWDLVAKKFAENGFAFLKFNFSHNGTSKERPEEFADLEAFGNNSFSKELFDLGLILDKVANADIGIPLNEFSRRDIYLIGHSRGAGTAVIKAYEDKRIKKLASWAGQMDFSTYFQNLEDWKQQGVRYIMNGRTLQEMPLYWSFAEDYLANYQRFKVENSLYLLPIPVLLAYGTEDNVIKPVDFSILKTKNTSNTCFFIDKANHVFNGKHPYKDTNLPKELSELVTKTIAFFKLN